MQKKLLLSKKEKKHEIKEIVIFENPEKLKPVLSRLTWKILLMLHQKEMYPMEIAKKLNLHEQKVYYHMRKLIRAGVIKKVKEEEKKGAIAKYYKANFPALGVELPIGGTTLSNLGPSLKSKSMRQFLYPILRENLFDGKIVVGSPDPHGRFKTSARDGHYASFLTFFLGQFAELPDDFAIKLDVDIKAEKEEGTNLILVGGPGTNLITQEINAHLPIRFNMKSSEHGFLFGGLVSRNTSNVYTADTIGVIAKIINPWSQKKRVIILAGNKAVGTKSCVLALTKFWKQTLRSYQGEDYFATVIQGFDLDGDGKVDSIDVLE
ncbi:MAG: helix-turn-helix domain-containing protein [Candidatus Bathyarchaeota archaeon]|nr:MAG: helix-turn-helix domain-containing protein [Candidatus Bathyarchaeota archaeon]